MFFQIPSVKNIYLYPKAIPMNWGEKKLTQICQEEMGIDPRTGAVFLFHNSSMTQMKVFFLDNDGSQEFQKLLPKGAFMFPVAREGEKFIKIERKKLDKLFKS